MKEYLKPNWAVIPKTRVRLVEILGKFYWMELEAQEFDKLWEEAIIERKDINTKS
jgi:hypothetical protein